MFSYYLFRVKIFDDPAKNHVHQRFLLELRTRQNDGSFFLRLYVVYLLQKTRNIPLLTFVPQIFSFALTITQYAYIETINQIGATLSMLNLLYTWEYDCE